MVSEIAHQKTVDFYFSFAVDRCCCLGGAVWSFIGELSPRQEELLGAIGLARVAGRTLPDAARIAAAHPDWHPAA
jgi:hypothetical protein